jgi:hypothetical protein
MSDTIQFVRDSLSGDAVNAASTFSDLMRDRIAGKIDALRHTTAANLLSPGEAEPTPEEIEEPIEAPQAVVDEQ